MGLSSFTARRNKLKTYYTRDELTTMNKDRLIEYCKQLDIKSTKKDGKSLQVKQELVKALIGKVEVL